MRAPPPGEEVRENGRPSSASCPTAQKKWREEEERKGGVGKEEERVFVSLLFLFPKEGGNAHKLTLPSAAADTSGAGGGGGGAASPSVLIAGSSVGSITEAITINTSKRKKSQLSRLPRG